MSKANKKGSSSSGGKGKGTVEIDPSIVRFTHARIRPFFTGCGKRIEDTIQEIIDGTTLITDLPLITVIENDGAYFSLNNRRLYTLKHIQSLGLLKDNKVSVYMKPALEREKKRYTVERCALQAKIMPEHERSTERDSADSGSEDEVSKQPTEGGTDQTTTPEPGESTEQPVKGSSTTTAEGQASDKGKKKASGGGKPAPEPAPAKASVALPAEVSKELKDLAKLVNKGKRKAVLSQLDEWEIAGLLSEAQRDFVCLSIGLR